MTSPLSRREWWVLSLIGCAVLIAFALIYLAAPAHAQEDVEAVAAEAGVDPIDLLGAVLTTHLPARTYLIAVGELQPPQPILTVWDRLAECESGGNWSVHAYHHGGLQFLPSTWTAFKLPGYPAFAYQASRAQQITVGQRVQAAAGWGQWPVCSRRLGLR